MFDVNALDYWLVGLVCCALCFGSVCYLFCLTLMFCGRFDDCFVLGLHCCVNFAVGIVL